jgi:hypothetical protein
MLTTNAAYVAHGEDGKNLLKVPQDEESSHFEDKEEITE